jgi:hypothetical protein
MKVKYWHKLNYAYMFVEYLWGLKSLIRKNIMHYIF